MRRVFPIVAACAGLASAVFAAAAAADTAYVTDMLRLGLYKSADGSGTPFDNLSSGDAVEIVQRNGNYALVRLGDGRQGWVKAVFLVTEKPARARLTEVEAEKADLSQALNVAQAGREKAEQALARLKEQDAAAQEAAATAGTRLARLEKQNRDYEARLDGYRYSLPLPWVAAALGLTLLAGFVAGWWWLDARIRRRHGGFRIY